MYYIYLIVNKVNGKTYVGQRKSSKEWYEDKYMGSGKLLAKAKKKYGIENFEKFLIQHCNTKEETNKAERFWIAEYRSRGKAEYNLANGGDGGNGKANKGRASWSKGKHLSDEHKRHISEAKKGKPSPNIGKHLSEEHKIKISESHKCENNPFYGKHHSDEAKQKISEAHKGNKYAKWTHRTDEQRQRMSETSKGENNPFYGKHHSDEAKQKISEAKKGKHWKLVDGKRVYY